ncbi:hypothetical protein B0H12DRAFT_1017084 [Mycena haematopus]|nr:hypothetical protein B0H12DRAFT_1017084 [Mycena haematopus]
MELWSLITKLGEQLNQNREVSANIYSQAGAIKTGFVLRRYVVPRNVDVYDAELERMNAAMTTENIALQHDNKQLNALIREYEQTLETLMNTFRNRAKDVQERELALSRDYESQLLARQEECDTQDLGSSTMVYESLGRISHVLRQLLRAQGGELPESPPTTPPEADALAPLQTEERELMRTLAAREPWATPAVTGADHALEREIELARLEKENEELRRMLGITPPPTYSTRPGGEEMGNYASYSPLHAGRQPHPRPFEPPLSMGGFNSPRRKMSSLAVRRAMGNPPMGNT